MSIQKCLLEGERPKQLPGKLIYVTASLYEGDWKSILILYTHLLNFTGSLR